jgi:hypothetical protein
VEGGGGLERGRGLYTTQATGKRSLRPSVSWSDRANVAHHPGHIEKILPKWFALLFLWPCSRGHVHPQLPIPRRGTSWAGTFRAVPGLPRPARILVTRTGVAMTSSDPVWGFACPPDHRVATAFFFGLCGRLSALLLPGAVLERHDPAGSHRSQGSGGFAVTFLLAFVHDRKRGPWASAGP